jgi:hypothetical protein
MHCFWLTCLSAKRRGGPGRPFPSAFTRLFLNLFYLFLSPLKPTVTQPIFTLASPSACSVLTGHSLTDFRPTQMPRISEELVRRRAEHNEGVIHSLEEVSLHQVRASARSSLRLCARFFFQIFVRFFVRFFV